VAKKRSDWSQYFEQIKTVCPWSWRAWQEGQILITKYRKGFRPLAEYQAIIYITDRKPRLTKKFAKKLQQAYPRYEFLVSDQSYGPNGTPTSVIIQQDMQILHDLRHKLGVKNPSQ